MSEADGSVTLWLSDTPPSFNAVGFTGNRWALTRAVKSWKELLGGALLAARLPRGCDHVRADARLTFPETAAQFDARGRDEENYRVILSKALGDVLAPVNRLEGRWIPNDTAEHFTFGLIELRGVPRRRATEIVLQYRLSPTERRP